MGICEDDGELRSVLKRALETSDFEVRAVASGHEAHGQRAKGRERDPPAQVERLHRRTYPTRRAVSICSGLSIARSLRRSRAM